MEPATVEVIRGDRVESLHRVHAVVHDGASAVEAWGDPARVTFPRSSCKMMQALPLVESGAADAAGLTDAHLALACASHQGDAVHTEAVAAWLAAEGLSADDLRCGAHEPYGTAARDALIRSGEAPCQIHNNCSGKHAGFLTLNRRLGGGAEYVEVDHPVQRAVRAAFEEVCGEESAGWGIDGCSAPNFAVSLDGFARGLARFARAGTDRRGAAMRRLRGAMAGHPVMVAGEGRACTALMRAMDGVAVKTGAEAVFAAILPDANGGRGLGIAVKVEDGATRAAEAVIAALLVRHGALDPAHPEAQRLREGPIANRRGIVTGGYRVLL